MPVGGACGAISIVDALTATQASARLFIPTFEQELVGDLSGLCNTWIDGMGVMLVPSRRGLSGAGT